MKNSKLTDIFLLIVSTLTLLCVIFLPLQQYPINIISYIILAVFLPGYAFVEAIFVRKGRKGSYKIILSILISLIISVTLILLDKYNILNYNPQTTFVFMGILTILLSFIAIYRQHTADEEIRDERLNVMDRTNILDISNNANDKTIKVPKDVDKTAKDLNKSGKSKLGFKSLDLILVFLAALICLIVIVTPNMNGSIIKTALTILLILFLPGYSLVAVLYPKKNDLDIFERMALSFGFPLVGFVIVIVITNLIPIKINLNIVLELLAIITLILISFAFIRRKRVSDDEAYVYSRVQTIKDTVKPELYVDPKTDKRKYQETSSKNVTKKDIVKTKETSKNFEKQTIKKYPSFVSKDLLLVINNNNTGNNIYNSA